ncbi:hypothetical protein [Streptomyces sp. NPDC059874]|uniref:hypothetical protein n=1 Tax=Streptomyces sp. NPDC059874 TaxID=3346983 RepID=UPI003658AC92
MSPDLVDRLEREGVWEGVVGFPNPVDAPQQLGLVRQPLGVRLEGIRAVTPVADGPGERWIVVSDDGLIELDTAGDGAIRRITALPAGPLLLDGDATPVVATDRVGRFVAVASAEGRHGAVIETSTGRVTMHLDRGDYHEDVCRFPLAFADIAGRTVLVHATEWNRLDCSDPSTGARLTDRDTPQYRTPGDKDAHYLDYFFCGLSVSPGGRRIVSDGWVWHPWGVLAIWDLEAWLGGNSWESEDGPSRFVPDPRPWVWDAPRAWIDDNRLAVWGFGVDKHLHHGVRIYDVERQEETDWFPGPTGELTSDGTLLYVFGPDNRLAAWGFAVDEHLHHGLAVYDIATGHRLLSRPGLTARARHPRTGRLLAISDDGNTEIVRITKSE